MKTIVFLFASLTITSITIAQKGTHFAIKVIPQNVGMLNKEDANTEDYNYQPTWKVAVGGTADYHFTQNFGIGIGVTYSPQGQYRTDYNDFLYKQNVSYIKIPVLFSYNSNPTKKVMAYAQLGPQIAFLVDANLTIDQDVQDLKSLYKKVSFGVGLQAGSAFNLPKNIVLFVGIKSDFDFTNAINKESDYYYLLSFDEDGHRSSTHNYTVGVEAGIKYVLRKDRRREKIMIL